MRTDPEEMLRIIKLWAGCFKVTTRKDGYRYAIMGYHAGSGPVYVGPGKTEEALIQMGYTRLYERLWYMVNE